MVGELGFYVIAAYALSWIFIGACAVAIEIRDHIHNRDQRHQH